VPDNSEGVVEQAQDAETESEEEQETQPSKRKRDGAVFQEVLDGITVSGTSSAAQHRQAIIVCQILVALLQSSKLLEVMSELAGCNLAELIDFDLMEYSTCEHRRLLCKPRNRQKKPLTNCTFVSTHATSIRTIRQAMVKWMIEKHPFRSKSGPK
jgi:hypothetical protein